MILAIFSTAAGFLLCVTAAVIVTRLVLARQLASRNRGLFRFHDGVKVCEVDPISVLMALEAHPKFRLDVDPRRAIVDGDQQALDSMADAVRSAFGVPAFTHPNKPGLTVFECVELLAVFMLYTDAQKKNSKSPATSQQPMESTSSESSEPTTPNMSASG